ncbi:phosphopyruvate hydratase [Candidatus Roizmanbacteria bacterium RIFCSPHIGHO2_02_FULL_37_15]|uniref:Enolase n=1 Tax=Candidatus Roizmanbacteria bacterium RIFCSPLOWO2_01_FULL_37_16 TaxID=1802058 RepID=A0A1F7IKP7_9BACT|nr:MAG: phosphopyruvate hydratase [Candidatus Roizmanbacteria bacterium RIFCSPHIGHO2_01_FULL_37_16b]OGK22005.1 MAG: phosphopyruvate hydratase [Candidatus Roizmanbacteria bacterium RIFCSPHIGHO2_02_FULL_37_15]OGK31766.1 MAG: phosphopyruvate hydratase [Candidatus Roizmanbacteria bacterium RIFCSPHIGHO2_12_FULL_36_11]OGK43926.1 MAG: phosphopyruvate hydratase [Candidatus Roizmanbacteria bacterium RIFCSPLOWO2_01_FULL_37_16]
MTKIKRIYAYEIIDSRGYPTIEGRLILDNGLDVTTSIPAGTSIGKSEAHELRDNDKMRFDAMGVTKAVSYINDLIGPKLIGVSPLKQQEIDMWLIKADGTKNKSKLGGNTILTISQLMVKAAALDLKVELFRYINSLYQSLFKSAITIEKLPAPIFNIINGGKHANNNLEIQEFQVIPSSSYSFTDAYRIGVEIYHELQRVLAYRNANITVGEEGGFAPDFPTNLDAVEILIETIAQKNLKIGLDVFLGLDVAASHFYHDGKYQIKDKPHPLNSDEYFDFILKLITSYPILVLEDPLYEDDWQSWAKLNQKIPKNVYLVGDDLLTTNKERLEKAIREKTCTTVLIKPNQIGTITETLEVIDLARKNNFNYIVSHRSGETNDSFIADFAVAVQSDFVKFGASARGERLAKYNRLWQIEREELKK